MGDVVFKVPLSEEMVADIRAVMPPGRTLEESIEELLVAPVSCAHFLKQAAPERFYSFPEPVSEQEVAAVRKLLDPVVRKATWSGQRREAVAMGLLAVALDVCREMAETAGYEQPVFASAELAEGLLDGLIDAHYRKHMERDLPEE